jgi:hypothetical protein
LGALSSADEDRERRAQYTSHWVNVLQWAFIVIRRILVMGATINARLPLRVEQKLAEYCAKRGVTRSEALVCALDHYLDQETGGVNGYSLAADLIPSQGVKEVQSDNARKLARRAFRGSRSR